MDTPQEFIAGHLPQYKSHKLVRAAKIVAIDHGARLDIAPHGVVEVGPSWIREKHAEVGGYYVVYEGDGYSSYSPAKAFEEGYTRIQPTQPVADVLDPDERAVRVAVVSGALIEARKLAANPERMYTERSARAIIEGLLAGIDSSQCFAKALANGEEVFVLRSIDMAAPAAIRAWASLAAQYGCRVEKTAEAHAIADRWEESPNRKKPD